MNEDNILCVSNAYTKQYYFNPRFSGIPEDVQAELQILCVLYTEDIGGILTLRFEEDGSLFFDTIAEEADMFYDDIGSGLKIRQIQREKEELLTSLEEYYRTFFLEEW